MLPKYILTFWGCYVPGVTQKLQMGLCGKWQRLACTRYMEWHGSFVGDRDTTSYLLLDVTMRLGVWVSSPTKDLAFDWC